MNSNQKLRVIHGIIERIDVRINRLIALRDKLQELADRYDEQDQHLDSAVGKTKASVS